MLRHVRQAQIYWYCSQCKQEMPNLTDWQPINVILNNFHAFSCQIPTKFPENRIELPIAQKETVQG